VSDTVQTVHFKRQFLAPEQTRYDQPYCTTYVYFDAAPNAVLELESELVLSDGYHTARLDYNHWDDDPDAYLAMLTKLMEQVIAYRQGFAEALAKKRGQSVSVGADASIVLNMKGDEYQ
jgi:hypothetical protein